MRTLRSKQFLDTVVWIENNILKIKNIPFQLKFKNETINILFDYRSDL